MKHKVLVITQCDFILIGLDGQSVIIFGGTATINLKYIPPGDSLYALNLTNNEWSTPKSSGTIPNSRMYHQANVFGKYMVISFGKYNIILFINYYYYYSN